MNELWSLLIVENALSESTVTLLELKKTEWGVS